MIYRMNGWQQGARESPELRLTSRLQSIYGIWTVSVIAVGTLAVAAPDALLWVGVAALGLLAATTIYGFYFTKADPVDDHFWERDDFWEWWPMVALLLSIPALVAVALGLLV
jgi:hypothetical protein